MRSTNDGRSAAGSSRRLDIQGLRALAVLMVVAFHAGLPVPGGFVGVDVFFVISGFVITGMLLREREATGRIRFGAFYLRRFKRLTPALALMVAVTAVVSSLVLSPPGPSRELPSTAMRRHASGRELGDRRSHGRLLRCRRRDQPPAEHLDALGRGAVLPRLPGSPGCGVVTGVEAPALQPRPARRRRCWSGPSSFLLADVGSTGYAPSWLLGFYSPVTRAWEFAGGALLALVAARLTLESPQPRAGCWRARRRHAGRVALAHLGQHAFPRFLDLASRRRSAAAAPRRDEQLEHGDAGACDPPVDRDRRPFLLHLPVALALHRLRGGVVA